MINEFVKKFEAGKSFLEDLFKAKHPENYIDIVTGVMTILGDDSNRTWKDIIPDPERIHQIDDSDAQGTLLFVIAERGPHPRNYWAVKIAYGSCCGCDTLESIRNYEKSLPSESQVKDYMTLALHIVQGLTVICGNRV